MMDRGRIVGLACVVNISALAWMIALAASIELPLSSWRVILASRGRLALLVSDESTVTSQTPFAVSKR